MLSQNGLQAEARTMAMGRDTKPFKRPEPLIPAAYLVDLDIPASYLRQSHFLSILPSPACSLERSMTVNKDSCCRRQARFCPGTYRARPHPMEGRSHDRPDRDNSPTGSGDSKRSKVGSSWRRAKCQS